jgi:ribonuclease P protein component
MSASDALTLGKEERITSRKLIDMLFNGGQSHSMAAFPLRLVFLEKEREGACPPAQMLVSVPKRCFKRAVKRNRVKRQVREAFRHYKHLIGDVLPADRQLALAFIWLDDRLYDSAEVEQRVVSLLERLAEKMKSSE